MRGWAHSGPSEQVREGQTPGSHPPPPVSETLSCPASRGDMCKQSRRLGVGWGGTGKGWRVCSGLQHPRWKAEGSLL